MRNSENHPRTFDSDWIFNLLFAILLIIQSPIEDLSVFLDKIHFWCCRNTFKDVINVHQERHAIYYYRQAS